MGTVAVSILDSMLIKEKDPDKRANTRLDLSLEISLPDQSGRTINISPCGVYFEVITNDIDAFAIGTILQVQIAASTTTPGFEDKMIKLDGNGRIVRNDIKEVSNYGNKLCIALQFKKTLSIVPSEI